MNEQWKDIVNFENMYMISDLGRVWSAVSNRYLSTPPNKYGYLHFCLSKDNKQYTKKVHTEMAKAFLGEMLPGQHVKHINGDKTDNRLENLAYGTSKQNMDDMRQPGYMGKQRLSHMDIEKMNELAFSGAKSKGILKEFNISPSTMLTHLNKRPIDIRKELMFECIKNGFGVKLTASYFDVPHSAVVNLMKKYYGGVREIRKKYPQNKSLSIEDIARIILSTKE